MFPRVEVDGEGVLVVLTGQDGGSGHLLATPTPAAPVLQQVILQHTSQQHRHNQIQTTDYSPTCGGLKNKPPVLPALDNVGELVELPLPPPQGLPLTDSRHAAVLSHRSRQIAMY